ncbi:galactose oxidase [Amanita rubescens]|nr:galactose oxidase [Amanita rubescens]
MLHSIYDLTTFCRKTSGDVPPKLVGASTTVVSRKMYLFGGRLVSERRIVADMYAFDMDSFTWERLLAHPDDHVPRHRYFHSTDAWNNHLVVFGGMTNDPEPQNTDDLCVLNDVHFFDLSTRRWVSAPALQPSPEANIPRARYAHLSAVTANKLFIIGGQDFNNTWLDNVCVFDLHSRSWIQRRDYPRHCGTYRSIAVASSLIVRTPEDDARTSSTLLNPGSRFRTAKTETSADLEPTPSESLIHLPHSAPPSEDQPCDIYLYSNYNFTDVKRELEVFSPLPEADFSIRDQSSAMTGSTFPPGLRFPNGAILGTSLIIAGTYLAHSYQSFSIWALDLVNMTWSRIDPGKALETGSWFRACLWAEASKFLIFGDRNGNLVEDYNRRLLSWEHVAVVDLEAFGIYQPPQLKPDLRMQEFGLAALEEQVMADFEFICDDGRRIPCSRKLLEDRWPWFREQRLKMLQMALSTSDVLPSSSMHTPLPSIPGGPDPRLTPRTFQLSEPFPITLAFLQYFYAQALITPLQHAPAVLSQLLVLSTVYSLPHLEVLVRHAMHRMLSNSTSVAVYEVATLCGCRSLQIRALKTVMVSFFLYLIWKYVAHEFFV